MYFKPGKVWNQNANYSIYIGHGPLKYRLFKMGLVEEEETAAITWSANELLLERKGVFNFGGSKKRPLPKSVGSGSFKVLNGTKYATIDHRQKVVSAVIVLNLNLHLLVLI